MNPTHKKIRFKSKMIILYVNFLSITMEKSKKQITKTYH